MCISEPHKSSVQKGEFLCVCVCVCVCVCNYKCGEKETSPTIRDLMDQFLLTLKTDWCFDMMIKNFY